MGGRECATVGCRCDVALMSSLSRRRQSDYVPNPKAEYEPVRALGEDRPVRLECLEAAPANAELEGLCGRDDGARGGVDAAGEIG